MTYERKPFKRLAIPGGISVVVCTDFSGKEPHRQVGVVRVVTSGSLGGEMVGTLAQSAKDVSSFPALGAIFPISITAQQYIFKAHY